MDELKLVAKLGNIGEAAPSHLDAVRRALVSAVGGGTVRPRRTNRVLAAAAAAVALGGGSLYAGLRLSSSTPSTNTTIECGLDTYIPSESGDPVADCYAALSRTESDVPALEGWVTPSGLVAVLPNGVTPPRGSRALPSGFQISVPIRYANDALNDQGGPLNTGCLTESQATDDVDAVLAVAGLRGWQVSVSGGGGSCPSYFSAVDPATSTVTVSTFNSSPGAGATNVGTQLDGMLGRQLAATCATAATALALARDDAPQLGIAQEALSVSDGGVIGASPRCARAFVEPGGAVDVVVWVTPVAPEG